MLWAGLWLTCHNFSLSKKDGEGSRVTGQTVFENRGSGWSRLSRRMPWFLPCNSHKPKYGEALWG